MTDKKPAAPPFKLGKRPTVEPFSLNDAATIIQLLQVKTRLESLQEADLVRALIERFANFVREKQVQPVQPPPPAPIDPPANYGPVEETTGTKVDD